MVDKGLSGMEGTLARGKGPGLATVVLLKQTLALLYASVPPSGK